MFHFTELNFGLRFLQSGRLPEHKSSAIRGGMGQMLLNMFCMGNAAKCEQCMLKKRCIVQNIMYAPFQIKPKFVTEKESAGYSIFCSDTRQNINAGDIIWFRMLFYGDMAAYFNPVLQAIHTLGQKGLGKNAVQFEIFAVQNRRNEDLLVNNNIFIENLQIQTLSEYISERKRELKNAEKIKVAFLSPCSVKYHGEFLKEFDIEPILQAIARRIYMYCLFEGIETEFPKISEFPKMLNQKAYLKIVPRYSERNQEKIKLHGIIGWMELEHITEDVLELLLAGEITQIGKNTKFGFGVFKCLMEK